MLAHRNAYEECVVMLYSSGEYSPTHVVDLGTNRTALSEREGLKFFFSACILPPDLGKIAFDTQAIVEAIFFDDENFQSIIIKFPCNNVRGNFTLFFRNVYDIACDVGDVVDPYQRLFNIGCNSSSAPRVDFCYLECEGNGLKRKVKGLDSHSDISTENYDYDFFEPSEMLKTLSVPFHLDKVLFSVTERTRKYVKPLLIHDRGLNSFLKSLSDAQHREIRRLVFATNFEEVSRV